MYDPHVKSSCTLHEITKFLRFVKIATNSRLVSNFLSKNLQSSLQMYCPRVENNFFAKWQSEIISNTADQMKTVYGPTYRFQLFGLSLMNC